MLRRCDINAEVLSHPLRISTISLLNTYAMRSFQTKLYICTAGLVCVQFNGLVTGLGVWDANADRDAVGVLMDYDDTQGYLRRVMMGEKLGNQSSVVRDQRSEIPWLMGMQAVSVTILGQQSVTDTTDQRSETPCISYFTGAKAITPLNNNIDYNDYQDPVHIKALPGNYLADISCVYQQTLLALFKPCHTSNTDMTHRLLSLTLLLSGFAATHAPTEAVAPALGVWEQVNNPKATDRSSASTTASSVHPADSSSAQSTPALTHLAEPKAAEDLGESREWYNYFEGIYTFDLKTLTAEIRANWDNLATGETVNGWKKTSSNIIRHKSDKSKFNEWSVVRNAQFVSAEEPVCGLKFSCFDLQSTPAEAIQQAADLLRIHKDEGDFEYINHAIAAHINSLSKAEWIRSLKLAKDYNPETSHTTPTALKLPEMETAPALLKELLQVLKSPSSTNTITRLPSAAAPDKAPLEGSPVLR